MRRSSLRFSFHVVMVQARMIRGLVASIRGGPAGADRGGNEAGAGGLGPLCRRRCALIVTAGLAASRWRRTFRYGLGPKASAVRQVFSIPVPGPFSDNTVIGVLALRPMEKDSNLRQSDYESDALPTELSVVQTAGLEPTTSGPNPALSQLSYIRDPNPRSGAVYRAAKPPARAEAKTPTIVLASVFVTGSAAIEPATGCRKRHCRREFAASLGSGISATLPASQNVTRPSTRRPSPCGSTTTASPSRGEMPVSATMSSRWVTMTRLSEPE